MSCGHPSFGVSTFTDAQLEDELAFARFEKAAGGSLGQRTRVAQRIKALECELLNRILAVSA